ncbi:MAG: glycosyltransferase [Acidobacteriota bacterium]|nr:glycosyltransferase [Acidobacteriota bacterium]
MPLNVLACISLLIWLYLVFARGWFWRVSKHLAPSGLPRTKGKHVIVVIPARDEAAVIGTTVASLVQQGVRVLVVDDNSTDGTGAVARSAGAEVITGKALEPGWSGKLWALSQGVLEAGKHNPDYLLFTDADITHDPHSIEELVNIAEAGKYDLVSFMVKLACNTAAEKALIPAFVFFFFMLYPPRKTAGAAGGCILIRTDILRRIGSLSAIRREVIDDCALARAVAKNGGRVWLGLTDRTQSTRPYNTFAEVVRMISRTAFNQLHHSGFLLLGTIAGLILTYLLPPALLITGRAIPMILGGITWLLMTIAYLPMVRFYKRSPLWSLSLPLTALFYMGATLHSAVQYWTGRGGLWKGRIQDVRG